MAAFRSPLSKGFSVDFKDEEFSLLARAQFLSNPPRRKIVPQWSLEEALKAVKNRRRLSALVFQEQFFIILFLVATPTGSRVSELASIDRNTISFSPNFREANLPVLPGFLYKNQSASRTPPPIVIPAMRCMQEKHQIYVRLHYSKGSKCFAEYHSNE